MTVQVHRFPQLRLDVRGPPFWRASAFQGAGLRWLPLSGSSKLHHRIRVGKARFACILRSNWGLHLVQSANRPDPAKIRQLNAGRREAPPGPIASPRKARMSDFPEGAGKDFPSWRRMPALHGCAGRRDGVPGRRPDRRKIALEWERRAGWCQMTTASPPGKH
jgi:hypothetical protein